MKRGRKSAGYLKKTGMSWSWISVWSSFPASREGWSSAGLTSWYFHPEGHTWGRLALLFALHPPSGVYYTRKVFVYTLFNRRRSRRNTLHAEEFETLCRVQDAVSFLKRIALYLTASGFYGNVTRLLGVFLFHVCSVHINGKRRRRKNVEFSVVLHHGGGGGAMPPSLLKQSV